MDRVSSGKLSPLTLKNVTARWAVAKAESDGHSKSKKKHEANGTVNTADTFALTNLNIEFPAGKLIGIIGTYHDCYQTILVIDI